MRPFGCQVTILNTKDHLGKFDGKADEGFFIGYSLNSKDFRVLNSKTRIVEENLHIRFSKSTPNDVGSGPDWLFDIDALTRIMNYEPIVLDTQSNGYAGTKACNNARQARKETEPVKDYMLLPLWTTDPLFFQNPKSSHDDGFKPSSDNERSTNEDNELPIDPNMHALEDVSTFNFSSDDEDDGAMANMNNLDTTIKDYLGKFDAKADDGYFLGYSSILKAFRVYNTRRKQIEETYHVTFDESIEAIRFTNTSVYEIGIDDSSRYHPDEFFHKDDPSKQYQVDSDISYYVIPHKQSLTELT
uniref:Retrovirus-related Pol polyprotein from transposon TNT 1-94 n=1 Tax=Tanacetum cinerariifolium TaxID=118510 RepID=A0A699JZF6_TANCI|nr:retrovirus-related Pol polyprotein from transposon TNT 1-94 [Tanacetum cinerariifolium]